MLKGLVLTHKINKFYDKYGVILEYGYEFKPTKSKYSNAELQDILDDIHTIMNRYEIIFNENAYQLNKQLCNLINDIFSYKKENTNHEH